MPGPLLLESGALLTELPGAPFDPNINCLVFLFLSLGSGGLKIEFQPHTFFS